MFNWLKTDNEWDSCFEWYVVFLEAENYLPRIKISIEDMITKDLIANLYKKNEFYVCTTDISIAIVFLYKTPENPLYTKSVDKIMYENLDKFVKYGWLSYGGLNTANYNHEIIVSKI